VSDKIRLAPDQQSAVYEIRAASFAELGAKLDEFYASLDYSEVATSGSPSVSADIRAIYDFQDRAPLRVSMGSYFATVDIYKRGH
jgi:hypothetical protein